MAELRNHRDRVGQSPPGDLGVAWALLLGYLGARYMLFERLDQFFGYSSYLFEAAFVAFAAFYYRRRFSVDFIPDRRFARDAGIVFFFGFFIALILQRVGVTIPFAMEAGETVFLLVIVGPFLEEGLFRLALLMPLVSILNNRTPSVVVAVSAALFAAVHWIAVFQVDAGVAPFVAVQAVYALGLGGLCAWWMLRTSSILYPVVLHFLFNVGFYLGWAVS